ncbi:MAG: aminoglycoside/hydroxyurea antibiotic resistance kinase [Thermoleophilia bacterium]|nr:aminoglycoside/hydroxyurea antibiotic resistance kinase [Thermoleophilia bacterium]
MRTHPDAMTWLDSIPTRCAHLCDAWQLRIDGPPYEGGMVSYTVPVADADDRPLVLKLQWPHRESEHEAAALAAWNGNGAARLERHDPEQHALLMERCEPGTRLTQATLDEAVDAYADFIPRLAVTVPAGHPFTTLADEAAGWASTLEREWAAKGKPFERSLLDQVAELLTTLPGSQGPQVLIHQDLHADNVLAAQRQPWLVVDPKPLVGEVEFMVGGILRSFDVAATPGAAMRAFDGLHDRASVLRRFEQLTSRLDVDRERSRDWAVAHFIAWCFDSSWIDVHVQSARWLLEV